MIVVSLTTHERQTLFATRNQKRRLERLRARLACSPVRGGYRSPSFSGMPAGGGAPCGLDGDARANEAELATYERAQEEYKVLREEAECIANQMDERIASFAHSYFVDGKDMSAVSEEIGKDITTCWDYLNRIKGTYRRRGKNLRRCTTMYDNVR